MNIYSAMETTFIDKEDKRELILHTTLRLLSDRGFHGTPISMIANEAGIGAGTIYRYFENKEELINELFKQIKRNIIQAMLKNYSDEFSFKEQFKILWLNMMRYYTSHVAEFQFIEQHRYAPYMSNLTRSESMKILSPIMMYFIAAKRAKAIKELPLYTIISLVYGPIVSLAKLHHDHKTALTDDRMQQAVEACWNAIKLE